MKKILLALALAAGLTGITGCGTLIPKPVELFQKKVQKMPEATESQKETQRQAAALSKQKAAEVVDAAILEGSSTNILAPARDAERLTDAVSTSLGPPLKPANVPAPVLATKLDSSVAKLNKKVDSFADKNDELAGKKIEGTGLVSVPYFLWIAGIAAATFLIWHLVKTLAAASAATGNPAGVIGSVALGAIGNVAQSTVSKGFAQVVKGGENFKNWVKTEFDPIVQKKILGAFQTYQTGVQDQDVQATIKQLTTHQ